MTTTTPLTGDSTADTSGSVSNASDPAVTTGASDPTVTTGASDPTVTTGASDPTMTTGSTGTDPGPVCGDGALDPGEECDDGAANADEAACTAGCKTAICGDALVLAGVEQCDDGNNDNADACVTGCKTAVCGDGFVGPGEACDDGNKVDGDVCSNICAAASCGDGKLQMGEACDDGNKVDTDTCLNTCIAAKCGDLVVQAGVEQCDDANMSDLDMCTAGCKTPTCMDNIKSGLETDVDCGAACPKCAVGKTCSNGADCGTGICSLNKCVSHPSCKAIKAANPAAKDGIYNIDPDGGGAVVAFDIYCNMTIDGGGWTLVLKADGTKATFHGLAALWTNNALLNPGMTAFDHNEAKFSSWNTVPFTEVGIGIEYPIKVGVLTPAYLKVSTGPRASMFALISPGAFVKPTVPAGRAAWKSLIAGSSLQLNCNQEGFNTTCDGVGARIGIVSNQENDCLSCDSYIGIGAGGSPCDFAQERSVGNIAVAACMADNGDKNLPGFGAVFVR